ncbi:MAG: DEAD/DEAH box helicase [unclassified Hahellaceae]|nr:DEAD/DEAH box helicase [Hahellaceae bacterium]
MERQWFALKQSLTAYNDEFEKEVSEPYFLRLLKVVHDPYAGPSDKVKACQDALCCAVAHGIGDASLELPSVRVKDVQLDQASLRFNPLTGRISLREYMLSDDQLAVYRREQRRFLFQPNIDVALSKALKSESYVHYNGLGQQAAVRTTLTSPEDSTLFINLPTGCGKTLVAQALVLFSPSHKVNLIVVPTVGLAIEQANRIKELLAQTGADHGGPYAWYGSQNPDERQSLLEKIQAGTQRVLFCSPEAVTGSLSPYLFQLAENGQIGSLVVDEAHLVDAWGAEFRPEFQMLAPLAQSLQRVSKAGFRKVLMSATFNPDTLDTLKNLFCSADKLAIEVNGSFLRPEPSYDIVKTESREEHRDKTLEALWTMPRPLILYTTKVEEAESWHSLLKFEGFQRVGLFHGETNTQQRERLIEAWHKGDLDVMVATSAFGVGMNKSDVRSVLHAAVPENLDRFYQESGRGGRDGNASLAKMIYYPEQLEVAQNLATSKLITSELGLVRWNGMRRNAHQSEDGYWKVSLATLHKGLDRNSKRNRSWNWRTLLLMRRAGLIDIHLRAFSPPVLLDGEEWSSESYQERLEISYREYSEIIDVEIIEDGHKDEGFWLEVVNPRRDREKDSQRKAYKALEKWIKNPRIKLCEHLGDFYTHEGIAPEVACGGCPGCRFDGLEPFSPTLGFADEVTGWHAAYGTTEQRFGSSVTFVHYSQLSSPRVLLQEWRHWISDLLNKGEIQAVRAHQDTLEQLQKCLPPGIRKFWCSIDEREDDSRWAELVLLMPHETEIPDLGFVDSPRIVVAPDNIPSNKNPYRKWWETNQYSIELEHFVRQLSYVHN